MAAVYKTASSTSHTSRLVIGALIASCLIFAAAAFVYSSMQKSQSSALEIDAYDDEADKHIFATRVCCFILTAPKHFLTRTKSINDTWAPRCDRYFFVTEQIDESATSEQLNFSKQIPIAPLPAIHAGYNHLTLKSTLLFLFAYENYLNDYDWFVKADDDTYMVVDNLKRFLSEQDPAEPVTFGYNFKIIVTKGYHSGGAAYVLSREAVKRFYKAHQNPASKCRKDGGAEDVEIAKCLRNEGVYPGKSLDRQNRELFHPLQFTDHFYGAFPGWLEKNSENPLRTYYDCCGDQTISFHYIPPEGQYLMDFLLYGA